jgi:hypothetical protein
LKILRSHSDDICQKYFQETIFCFLFGITLLYLFLALASGSYISAFVWNGGADWKNQKWTPELPTDTQVLFNPL